jgi:hypothetical protein
MEYRELGRGGMIECNRRTIRQLSFRKTMQTVSE